MTKPIQFSYEEDISDLFNDGTVYSFYYSMVSTCAPLFNEMYDNYEVADCLKKAGVINEECSEDSESCGLGVYFDSEVKARGFIKRLNEFLIERAQVS